jgi:hypothetical protein
LTHCGALSTIDVMKQVNYDGHSLVTGSAVADALVSYAANVARMTTSTVVEIPVLEEGGEVGSHTLLLNSGTALEIVQADDGPTSDDGAAAADAAREAERFPVPKFQSVGGKAVAIPPEEEDTIRPPITDT